MKHFRMNGVTWRIQYVLPNDSNLVDRTGMLTVATTDPATATVYISGELRGEFRKKVLIHELAHCAMISYGIVDQIAVMTRPEYRVEMEETICNFLADYGERIYNLSYEILGPEAIYMIPGYINKICA